MTVAVAPPRRGKAGLLPKQLELIRCRDARVDKIVIYRGGYRSGKTTGLVAKAIDLGARHWPYPVLAVEPSFPMIRAVFVATAMRLCRSWGLAIRWQESKKTLTIGTRRPITIWCRSADAPRSMEGLTVGSLVGDEWELWDVEALKVAMARVSIGPEETQQIVLGGTPEGFGPGYRLLEERPAKTTRVIVSRTADNFTVRSSYVADMQSRLSEAEIAEKLFGERTAPEGRVFTRFEMAVHTAFRCVEPTRGRMEVWCGFNELLMAWAFVLVDDASKAFHVIGEIVTQHTDSQAQAAEAVKWLETWHNSRGHNLTRAEVRTLRTPAICDAEGQERAARAPLSHVVNIQEQGFAPLYPKRNPSSDDRIASVQKLLAEKRLTFDAAAAPYFTRCISQQRKGPDGSPIHDNDLEFGAHVIGNGAMWHSPAFKPGTEFGEAASARVWDKLRRPDDVATAPPDLIRSIPGVLLRRMAVASPGSKHAGSAVTDLGCSIAEFIEHIEGQFADGMTWANHGKHGWHLDHKRPLSSFNLEDRAQFLKAAHWSNYQPLWAADNLKKGAKWDGG